MRYFVYVLRSVTYPKSYVGSTDNLERRLGEHNKGKSFYTSRYKPWKILYTEEFPSLKEARAREKYLKSRGGRRFLKDVVFINHPS